ncbi:Na+/H+ antiporter NhaC family protein [Oceanospirillum sediminis]|uniref:Na+/H+ antiporter NhaC family protein n=1 Tax=Oceanospirillum sediminis TaxID=2760088 RepID=UPI0027BA8F95|nr:Na+/H+ antiporter NhaC family protein [Oceanospirillum sediminis]
MLVLFTGILAAGLIGLIQPGDYSLANWSKDIYNGYTSMQEILILSLLIGGLGALMKAHGGLEWLAYKISSFSQKGSARAGEISISLSVVLTNLCTANNTVAIVISGGLAKEIAQRYGVDPRRSASLMDIVSCVVQGIIPWGAQMLLAASIASISPLELVSSVQYCWLLALVAVLSISTGYPSLARTR